MFNKFFFQFLILSALFCALVNGQDISSSDCIKKSEADMDVCSTTAGKQWNLTMDQLDGKDANVPAKMFCCAYWQAMDCAMEGYKKNCNATEIKILQADFEIIKSMYDEKCVNFTYHSSACATAPPTWTTLLKGSYPDVPILAKPCMDILNNTNVVSNCYDQAMAKWPRMKNGKLDNVYLERDTCCFQYNQMDCQISAIKSGKCTGNDAEAALFYQDQILYYWETGHCLTVPYKSGLCASKSKGGASTSKFNPALFLFGFLPVLFYFGK